MQYLTLILTILLLSGCSRCSVDRPCWLKLPKWDCSYFRFPWSPDPEYLTEEVVVPGIDEDEAINLVWSYANQMEHEFHLKLEDSKVLLKGGMISGFNLSFITQDLMVQCEARALIVDITDNFMSRVQDDDFLSGYLPTDFSAANLEIHINFESYFGLFVDQKYIGWIVLEDGLVYFYAFDVKDMPKFYAYTFWHGRVEPFHRSRQIVLSQRVAEEAYQEAHQTKTENKLKDVELFYTPTTTGKSSSVISE